MTSRILVAFCVLIASWTDASTQVVQSIVCDTLDDCLSYVTKPYECRAGELGCDSTGDYFPIAQGYFELPQVFEKFGRVAVPRLLPLLKSADATIRSRAALVLNDSQFLLPSDRQDILSAWKSGNKWLDNAAAKMATPELIEEVINSVLEDPFIGGDDGSMRVDGKFGLLFQTGTISVPALLARLQCRPDQACRGTETRSILRLLSHFEGEADFALPQILNIALNPNREENIRLAALEFVTRVKLAPETDRLKLRVLLKDKSPEIRNLTAKYLTATGDPSAIEGALVVIESLSGWERGFAIANFSNFGTAALSAAPKIRKYLKDENWDVRAEAAKTLGEIGDLGAVHQLVTSITPEDWLLAFRSAVALGKLKGPIAQDALERAAREYWNPVVRLAASNILAGKPVFTSEGEAWRDRANLFSPLETYCASVARNDIYPEVSSQQDSRVPAKSGSYAEWFDRNWSGFVADFEALRILRGATRPGTRIISGAFTFVGTDNGEWGGKLTVSSPSLRPTKILEENIVGIFATPRGLFAATGLAHLSLNYGFLYEVRQVENGEWRAIKTLRLTGAPSLRLAPNGTIGVATSQGSMLVHPDGRPEWLKCAPAREN